MIRAFALLLITCAVAIGQPAPILRNAMTTNVAGTPVKSVSDLSVTNFTTSTATQWNFYGVGPNTVARLIDITNIVATASGSATNAVSVIQSNGVVVSTGTTNLDFVDSPTVTVLMTNNPMGLVHISFAVTGGFGETNFNGDAGITNATRIGLADGKANNTNLIKTLMAGNGIVLTNNVGGTNVMIAVDPVLDNLIGTVANNVTNVISPTSNSVSKPLIRSYQNGTLTLMGLQEGSGIDIVDNTGSNYVISWSGFAVRTNGNTVLLTVDTLNLTESSGILVRGTAAGTVANVNIAPDWSIIASQTNLTAVSNVLSAKITNGFIRLQVSGFIFPTNLPPQLDQGTNQTWRLLFDDTTNEVTYTEVPLPIDYGTNANLRLFWSTLAAAANTSNVWEVAVMVVPSAGGKTINADSYNGGTESTNQVYSTAGYLNTAVISCNATSAIAGDLLKIRITRKGTNLFDNATGDAALHSAIFEYIKK